MSAVQSSTSLDKEPALAGYLEMIYSSETPKKEKEEDKKTEVMKENTLDYTLDIHLIVVIHHSKVFLIYR